jgi:translocation and assembly module TamB
MTQGNQLSYLVLGRPLSGASVGEGSALSRAVLALGLKGGNVVAEKIGGKLGLDQFAVESNENRSSGDAQQASLVIGKYLTPKLYINYGIGLFDPASTLRMQYAISSSWKLVTESTGTASGGDFIYTIETGH